MKVLVTLALLVVVCQARQITIRLPAPPKAILPPGIKIKLPKLPVQIAGSPADVAPSTDGSSTDATGSTDSGSTGATDTGSTGATDSGSTGSTDSGTTGTTESGSSDASSGKAITIYDLFSGNGLIFKNSDIVKFIIGERATKSKSDSKKSKKSKSKSKSGSKAEDKGDATETDAPAGDAPAGDAPAGDAPAADAPAADAPAK